MRVVLLAGGGGTRLWPLSRHDFPKQFLDLGMGLSLLQKSVLRLASAPFITDIVVATNQVYPNYHHKRSELTLNHNDQSV